MIIYVSIVDKHKPPGQGFCGGYSFEVPLDANGTHYDILAVVAPKENESECRVLLNKFLLIEDIPNPVDRNGKPITYARKEHHG